MRALVSIALITLAACGDGDDTDTGSDTATGSDTGSDSATGSDTGSDSSSDTGSDTGTDTWSGVDVFGGAAPGEGQFAWVSAPHFTVDTCGINGPISGNGYVVSDVNPVALTFTLQPDSGGAMASTECSYDLSGAFTCGPESTVYDMATYGMVGLVTQIYQHSGTFIERTRTISGADHTFSASWSFDISSTYTFECTGDAQSCQAAATNGWGFNGLPCSAHIDASTMSFDDPSFPI